MRIYCHARDYVVRRPTVADLEEHYWGVVDGAVDKVELTVEYGNDLDASQVGSGFPMHPAYAQRSSDDSGSANNFLGGGDASDGRARGDGDGAEGGGGGSKSEIDVTNISAEMALDACSSPWNLSNLPNAKGSCVRACVRVCVCACVRVCACVLA
jgi:hypothetical protein